ncbi:MULTISPECIES: hypothetical protein [Lactobacillus]|uniref:hypothetical protein n=1 Tax=Lactobacillus TaxID=1578 RepID=UPI0023BFB90D|nr:MULTISPECIES: hypothetical protein [Lactobacillus]MDE7049363.1 hypothetical protein [Lactobacillus sp.]
MKKFFKVVGIGAAICTGVGAAVAVTKKIIDKNNANEDVVEDEESEFEEPNEDSETTASTETE